MQELTDDSFDNPMWWYIFLHVPLAVLLGFPAAANSTITCGSQRGEWELGTSVTVAVLSILAALVVGGTVSSLLSGDGCSRSDKPPIAADSSSTAQPSTRVRPDNSSSQPLWRRLLGAFALPSNLTHMVAMGGDRSVSSVPLAGVGYGLLRPNVVGVVVLLQGPLAVLNGVRGMSMALVILGHTLMFQVGGCA